jgi:hypothetical protein
MVYMFNDYRLDNPTYVNYWRRILNCTYPHLCITNCMDAKTILEWKTLGTTINVVTRIRSLIVILDLDTNAIRNHNTNYLVSPCVYRPNCNNPCGTYSHVRGTIPINFMLVKLVVVNTHCTIPIVMTTWSSTITMFVSTMLPPNLRGEPSNPFRDSTKVVGRHIITCTQPFKRPLYYFEYKKK